MRRIVASAFVSLDGVMQGPGGPAEDPTGGFKLGGWTVNYWDDAMSAAMGETFSKPYDLLLGRRTYDIFAAHWPYAGDDDPIAKSFNAVTKYVATHRPDTLSWENSRALGEDVVGALRRIRDEDGPDLLTQGSSDLLAQLLAADLIDEFRLLTFPLVLGRGKRLFSEAAAPGALKLVKCQTSSSGVVIAVYERAGEIVTGDFQPAEPSPAERQRRAEMAAEG